MKKILFFFLFSLLLLSCKKATEPLNSQVISGTLYFSDPAVDGAGLFFETDGKELLLFKNEYPDYYSQYLHYKEFIGVHCHLFFQDTGTRGCTISMMPGPCPHPLRVVAVIKLVKQ